MFAITARVICAPWLRDPEVPVIVRLELAIAVEALAENVNDWGVPGVTVISEGATVTPAGRPLSCTLMDEVKPLIAVAERVADAVFPASMVTLVGLTDKLKSGLGVGDGVGLPPPPPPHDDLRTEKQTTRGKDHPVAVQAPLLIGLFFNLSRSRMFHFLN